MRVRVIAFVHQQRRGFGPALLGRAARHAVAQTHVEVALALKQGDEIVVQPAAAVEARVDNHRVLVDVAPEEFGKGLAKAGVVHGVNMQVADAARGALLDNGAAPIDPAAVQRRRLLGGAPAAQPQRALGGAVPGQGQAQRRSGAAVEQGVGVGARVDAPAVNGHNAIARAHIQGRAGQRTAGNQFLNDQTRALIGA